MSSSFPNPDEPVPAAPVHVHTIKQDSAVIPVDGDADDKQATIDRLLIGLTIGRYKLLRKLGAGGMGSVYLAEQSEPVKRQVALKLIRGSIDSRTVIARFEAERQVLALMDHSNIARIYDGGTTCIPELLADAVPFFVMELVQGVPITDYCDNHKLSPKERLELFIPICHAVQHAHQKGIIHRDLKPGNVLVTEIDGKPVPKVIDFGVAKATEQRMSGQSMANETQAIVGTPTYMSPEQADPESIDIDTRTDIYSLGVMLYELLTGSTPLDTRQYRRESMWEVLRMVREIDPPRPSTKLSKSETLPSVAANRSSEPRQLQAMIRGDIDWILMKAIEKDRSRRYETANAFAADVQRYLSGQAVLAHPPSRWYLVNKFVRRNRGQVLAAGLVVAALLIGLVVSLTQMARAIEAEALARSNEQKANVEKAEKEEQRLRAEKNLVLAEEQQKRAQREQNIAQAVREFLQSQFISKASVWKQSSTNSKGLEQSAGRHDITVRELLQQAARDFSPESIQTRFPGRPEVQAEILETIAIALDDTGDNKKGLEYLKAALKLRENTLGLEHPDTLATQTHLVLFEITAHHPVEAFRMVIKLVAQFEKMLSTSTTRESDELVGRCVDRVIQVLDQRLEGQQQALPSLTLDIELTDAPGLVMDAGLSMVRIRRGAELAEKKYGLKDRRCLFFRLLEGAFYQAIGRTSQAISIYERSLKAAQENLDSKDKLILGIRQVLLVAYRKQRVNSEIILKQSEQLFEDFKTQFGPEHPGTIITMLNLASEYADAGKNDLALALRKQGLSISKARLGPDHAVTFHSMRDLASSYQDAGNHELSLPLFEEALQLQKTKMGTNHPDTLSSMNNLALVYENAGQIPKAKQLFEETLKLKQDKQGRDNQSTLITMENLASLYCRFGQVESGIRLYEEALQLWKAKKGASDVETLTCMNGMANALRKCDRHERAVSLYEETLRLRKVKLGPFHPDTLNSMNNLALGLEESGQLAKAITLYEETIKLKREKLGNDHQSTLNTIDNLADCYTKVKEYEKATALFGECKKGRERTLGLDHPDTLKTINHLAACFTSTGRHAEAAASYQTVLDRRQAKLGLEHPQTAASINSLAGSLKRLNRLAEVFPVWKECLLAQRAKLGNDHVNTVKTENALALAYRDAKQYPASIELLESLWASRQRTLTSTHHLTIDAENQLGWTMALAGKFTEAEKHLLDSFQALKTAPDAPKDWMAMYCERLSLLYDDWKKPGEAETWRLQWKEQVKKQLGPDSSEYGNKLAAMSLKLVEDQKWNEALTFLRECLSIREKKEPDAWTTFNIYSLLGGALLGQKKYSEAEPLLVKGYEGMKSRKDKIPQQGLIRLQQAIDRLILFYTETNKPDEVNKWQAEGAQFKPIEPVKK